MTDWLDEGLRDRRQQGLYRLRRRMQSAPGAHIRWRGREFVNFSSNDYLNLAADPRLARAAARALRQYGCGSGASALVSGYLPPLQALEKALARWEGTEAALVFSSGFAANLAVVSALAGPEDAIFSDALNHASLIDGCRLSRACVHVYQHASIDHLHELLRHQGARARRRLIVTDTVFSMDGDLAPLTGLLDLAERYDAFLILDEAHATGVLGEKGRGVTELMPFPKLDGSRTIKVGTLSKALGCQGGFVCGTRKLIAWLVNTARPYIFSTALASPIAAAARRAIFLVQQEPERRYRLLTMAQKLRHQLQTIGYGESSSGCQIFSIVLGDPRTAIELSRRLEGYGLLVPAIRPPSVPAGTARLRISLTSGHSETDVQRLVDALEKERKKINLEG